ncbi:PRC-barrel domain-containing protein [Azorhizobium caulinodans]|uniref:PRC-barrel domain protein n=1 Tax=Azorhizobium caulinodans (strain ATCC 43989 / DSM 5975 / JCM 20966 / LMG 6465 / NBRC 14845 / NCIMB 13405 / ORS 571) TaxID=438753 RepID=A8HZN3_AZOC5|nr:PRC-barrel domain-containing protein [Azorhizobium caulinodans]BAF90603.1 PRC-barrel domain protein [Azorhizobium caulinodans ORS 571]
MVATDETHNLIAGDKVSGTNVYNTTGDKIGSIYDVMIDKRSGKVAYAVMSFGGFLGMGEDYHPLPWSTLNYDTGMGGYVVPMSREQLEGGPHYGTRDTPQWDRDYETRVHDYYKTPYYWS